MQGFRVYHCGKTYYSTPLRVWQNKLVHEDPFMKRQERARKAHTLATGRATVWTLKFNSANIRLDPFAVLPLPTRDFNKMLA